MAGPGLTARADLEVVDQGWWCANKSELRVGHVIWSAVGWYSEGCTATAKVLSISVSKSLLNNGQV